MAIIFNFNNLGTGTLSPPDLNDIVNINSPLITSLNFLGDGGLNFVSNEVIVFDSFGGVTFNNAGLGSFNFSGKTIFSDVITNYAASTSTILALTPVIGMQIFCSDINQMVFYQVSPITGLVLGWYNSTGTILL